MENTTLTPAEKRALTKEIKQTQKYLNDLLEQKERQGNKHNYEFEGRKCDRWMLHGEFFFPSTISEIKKELAELKTKRYPSTKNLTKGAQLTWVITKDEGVVNDCENATAEQKEKLVTFGYTEKFKMYDDDGELYYSGLAKLNADFDPLDDFGTPNAGCTEIRYYNKTTKKHETL